MKKLLKIFAVLVVVLVVLVLGAAVAVPMLIDGDDVKAALAEQVKRHTGRDLRILGEVEISVFPWLGAKLGTVEFGNAAGFSADVFARTEQVDVRVKLMPLLDRRVEMATVTVHGLQLNLEKNANGVSNWADLASAAGGAPAGGTAGGGSGSPVEALAIGGLDIRDAALSYLDARAGQAVQLRNLALKTGSLSPGKPVDVELGFDLTSQTPPLSGRLTARAQVDVDPATGAVAANGLEMGADLSYQDPRAGRAVEIKNLALKAAHLSPGKPVDMELAFDLTTQSPPLSGRLTASAQVDVNPDSGAAAVNGLELAADMKGAMLPGGAAKVSVSADAAFDPAADSLSVKNLVASVLDLKAKGAMEISALSKDPRLAGELAVAEFSPRVMMKALGLETPATADAAVLAKMSLKAEVSGSASEVKLKPLSLMLDDTTLSGEAGVSNFAAPAVRFALKLDAIDLDRYLPPSGKGAAATPGAASTQAAELPTRTLRGLDVAGSIAAGRVKISNLSVSDVSATLNARKGVIKLAPMTARLYQGSYAGNVVLDASGEVPKLSLDEKLSAVQLEPLLKDLQGDAPISGTANLSAKLSASGTGADSVMKTLNGNLSFQFLDGALLGVNIAQMIRDAKATIRGGAKSVDAGPKKTDFAEISGTAKVTDGTISNQDLTAKSPLLRLSGKGTAALPTQALDYRATATLVATSKGQGGKEISDLAGIPIPVIITGTFTEPSYALDVEALAESIAKGKAKELVGAQTEKARKKVEAQTDKVKKKAQESVKEKLGDGLGEQAGKLLGGDKQGGGGLLNNLLKN